MATSTGLNVRIVREMSDAERAVAFRRAESLGAALQKLRLTTGGRNLDTRETATLYADRLGRYPRDVIAEVCDR